MNKWFWIVGLAIVALGVSPVVAAPVFLAPADGLVSVKSPIGDDFYAAGSTIIVDQPIKGDFLAGGGTIEINADVSGDVIVAGGTVIIRGNVGDDVRVAGGQVSIYGIIGDDLVVGGGTVTVASAAQVKGDLVAAGGDLILDGKISGNLKTGSGTLALKGSVLGDAEVRVADSMTMGESARIGGTLKYWAPTEDPAFASHAGTVEYHKISGRDWDGGWGRLGMLTVGAVMLMFWKWVAILVLGVLIVLLFPKYLPKVVTGIRAGHWHMLWVGLLTFILTPLVVMVVMMTMVGIPIAILGFITYGLTLMLGVVAGAYYLGRILFQHDKTPLAQVGSLAAGTLMLGLLVWVPVVGWLAGLWVVCVGLGGVLVEAAKAAKQYR